jgi:hypothetical protein
VNLIKKYKNNSLLGEKNNFPEVAEANKQRVPSQN